jgi:DNA polymerase-3 subunit gamma/tau
VFVLCTTELQAMLPTIRSRCQRFVFQRPGLGEISEVLRRIATAEGIEIDDAAVQLVARAAGGSFRDGVTILDQLSTAQSAAIGAEDVRALLGTADEASLFGAIDLVGAGDAAGLLRLVDDLAESGTDLASFTTGLLGHLRGLFLTQQLGQPPLDLGLSDHEQERMREQAEAVTPRAVVRLIDLLRTVVDDVKEGGDPRLPLELALVKVSRPANELALEALDQRLSQLESNGTSPAPKPPPTAAPAPAVTAAAPAPPPAPDPAPSADTDPEPDSEPEPQAAAAPVATAVAEPATLDEVSARWSDAIVPEIGRRSVPLHSLVQSARPVSYEDDTLVLGLTASKAFAKSIIEAPQNLQTISDVVGQALGGSPRVRFVVLGAEDAQDAPEVAAPAAQVTEDELVSRLTEEFDAHEV